LLQDVLNGVAAAAELSTSSQHFSMLYAGDRDPDEAGNLQGFKFPKCESIVLQ